MATTPTRLEGKTTSALRIEMRSGDNKLVGAIESLSASENKQVTRIRHLDIASAGETVDVVPGVTDLTLTINGFMLYPDGGYLNNIFNRVDPAGNKLSHPSNNAKGYYNLSDQQSGFMIIEAVQAKDGNTYVVIYPNCWVSSRTKNMTVTGDTKVSESLTVVVGGNVRTELQQSV